MADGDGAEAIGKPGHCPVAAAIESIRRMATAIDDHEVLDLDQDALASA